MGFAFFIMYIWYITQPIVLTIINHTMQLAETFGANNTYVVNGITILTWIEYWWGPLFIIALGVLWIYLAAYRRVWTSRIEGEY